MHNKAIHSYKENNIFTTNELNTIKKKPLKYKRCTITKLSSLKNKQIPSKNHSRLYVYVSISNYIFKELI